MATNKAKESSGLGKERKITAPSSLTIPNTSTKRTPKSSPRGHSTDHKLSFSSSFSSSSAAHLSTLAEKHVPNYLKSTASSRHEHSSFKSTKKSAVPAPIPESKAGLNRRRSFDKPPSTAPRLDKPFRSPGPRNRVSNFPIRSSSFGAKSTTAAISSAKVGLLERSGSRNTKGGGGKLQTQQVQSLRSSNVKKSLKRESSNAASAEMVHKTKNSVEHVDPSPSFVLGMNDEELKKIECELDPYLPDPEFSKELRTDHLEKKAILDKEEAPQAAAAKSLEQNEGETEKGDRKVENPERIGVEEEEVVAEEEKTETDPDHDTDPDQEGEEGGIVLDKEGGAGGAKPRQGGGAGRASAVYNDVIEETASKLLEKRKNKVKALAGAFQTVIDYESSSK
ncbi:uncharacterized protein LOC111798751 [Cucurbita pepo subsp. pepo]|uniref:uncharacterized protein LOC111798751 n=1 Tax=Cucurbita pepo subsp. pepo TaxID=3664 RepID=UPI000C9D8E49|nr:uncharacterized protein LOC111798751 [Cucurbita pepo subsp. pepo]